METKKSDFLDKLVAMFLAPYGVFAFFQSGGWGAFKAGTRKGWQSIQDTLSDLEVAYTKKAGRWLQVVSGITGATFLLTAALMLTFWDKRADGFGLYQIVTFLSALFGALLIANIAWLQGAVPEYERDEEGRLIPDLETKGYRLSDSKRHRFGRISAIGLSVVLFVAFGTIFLGFMTLSVLQRSTALVVLSLPFFAVAASVAIFYERLVKFMVFQTQYYASLVLEEGMDFASVVLPDKVMADFFRHLEERKRQGKKAKSTNSNVSDMVIVPVLLAIFVHLFWVADHPGFVMWADLCILGMTLVPIIGLKTGQKDTVEKQKNLWFSSFVKFAMVLTVLAKFVEAKWFYAGYACGLFIPPSQGWKVAVLDVVLVGLGIFLFLVGSKAIKEMRKFTYVMWTAAAICFVLGIGTLISALADGGATTQACYDNVKARTGKKAVDSPKDSKAIVTTAPTTTATASASVSAPPPVKDEATKLAEATVNEIKKARTEIQEDLVKGEKLLSDLKQVSSDRAEGKPTVVALTASEKKATAKTSSAPTSSAKSSGSSAVAIVDSDAEVEAARKRLAAKYLQ